MNIIRKLLDLFKAGDAQAAATATTESPLTNKVLLEELTAHFKTMLKAESVGQKMLYPMSFNILMHPDDYEARRQSLPFVLPEVVAAFYAIIDNMRSEYPNYTPPANYWFFQFSACRLKEVQSNSSMPLLVRRGHLTTVATLMCFDIKNAGNVNVDTNTRVSIKLDDSNVMNDFNVNKNAIQNLDIISDGIFTYNFDPTLNRNTQRIAEKSNVAEVNGLAELSYSRGGRNYHFTMKDNLVHISGKNDTRNGREFFIIDEEKIANSHIQIKYQPEDKKFYAAAFGPARLNSGRMIESSGGNVVWYDLANNSSIFINDIISVKFEIK